ncbi:phage tail protein S [Escherichia coli]|uniref:Phage tail protein S n=1 Tax=Escherichia coli TaxID=562 RepID=A0A376U633_ECOLX|nr:phage tail protein S [Escherichia coli]
MDTTQTPRNRIQERIRFIWNNEARTLKNCITTREIRRTITGWDEDKNNIRTFYRDDIDRFLEIRTRRINQDSTKRVPMFVKLRTARYLKARADASGVTVGTAAWPHVLPAFISSVSAIQVAPGIFTDYPGT